MKIKVLLILAFPFLIFSCHKDEIKEEQSAAFIKFFADGDLLLTGVDVKPTSDGGYIVLGTATHSSDGTRDIYLLQADQFGNLGSWEPKLIGYENDDYASTLELLSDGYLIMGSSDTSGNGLTNMFLVKTDFSGNILWEKMYGGIGMDEGIDCQVLSGGGFVLAGHSNSFGTGSYDPYIITTDATGNVIYTYDFGLTDFDEKVSAVRTTSTGYLVIGNKTNRTTGNVDLWMLSLPDDLDFGLEKTYGNPTVTDYGEDLCITGDGRYFYIGISKNAASGLDDIVFGEFDPVGLRFLSSYSKSEANFNLRGFGMACSSDGALVITGSKTSPAGTDLLFLKLGIDGSEISRHYYGQSGIQQGNAIELTPADNGFIVVGTNGFEEVFKMITLVKTGSDGTLE